jgi:Cu(I)/Ag(I) efflux system membrane fusion protein
MRISEKGGKVIIDESTQTVPKEAKDRCLSSPRRTSVSARWLLRVVQVRLRFLFVLLAGFLIVGKWNVLRNYWDTLTTPSPSKLISGGINQETEYFCPMCPGVLSAWPTKCSVCNMPLVRRKKGGGQQLPDGVLARMQLSPYRIHLAGIQTATVEYRPLVREIRARGLVIESQAADSGEQASGGGEAAGVRHQASGHPEGTQHQASGARSEGDELLCLVAAEIEQRDIPFVRAGADALVAPDVELAGEPRIGRVLRIYPEVSPQTHRVRIDVAVPDAEQALWRGMQVHVRIRRRLAELQPFRSQPADPPPRAESEPRTLYTCAEHPDILRDKRERCPQDNTVLMDYPLSDLERVAWWCPMHPEVTADVPGASCEACNGMQLVPRIVQYRPAGEVLAAPESAILDLGDRRVVYVEQMLGMFDAVEVVVGPRCDGYYAIVRGLEPGQRVAATGAFLLDAESRLNPSVAAGYFGASLDDASPTGRPAPSPSHQHNSSEKAEIRTALDKLPPDERAAAERQKLCPITGMPLGSMGTPVKIDLRGKTIWLCCAGCEAEAAENPDKTLQKLKQIKQ